MTPDIGPDQGRDQFTTRAVSPKLTRFQDWPERLTQFLASCQSRRFAYGTHDCCLFAANAVLAMTGTDIAASFRGKYSTRKAALRLTKPSLQAFLDQRLSFLPSVPPSMAQRGDLMLIEKDNDQSLGIVALNGRNILKPGDIGFVALSNPNLVKAWRV